MILPIELTSWAFWQHTEKRQKKTERIWGFIRQIYFKDLKKWLPFWILWNVWHPVFETFVSGLLHVLVACFSSTCTCYFLDGWLAERIYMFVYLLMFDLITNVLALRQCNKWRSSSASGTHAGLPRLWQSNTEQRSVTPCMLSDCIMLYRICLCVLWLLIVSYCLSDKEKHERKRDARQKLQEEHGGRNRCRTQNPPRAARIAIKNSHILDWNSHILRELGQNSSSHQY